MYNWVEMYVELLGTMGDGIMGTLPDIEGAVESISLRLHFGVRKLT